jgi:hypothetical protein
LEDSETELDGGHRVEKENYFLFHKILNWLFLVFFIVLYADIKNKKILKNHFIYFKLNVFLKNIIHSTSK